MKQRIIAARDKAARAAKAAQDIALQMTEKQSKGEAVSDLEASFTKARDEAASALQEAQRLEQVAELNDRVGHFREPDEAQAVPHRGEASVVVRMEPEQFRAAHREAYGAFIRGGERAAVAVLERHKVGPQERQALISGNAELGGFLVPEDTRKEILKDAAGFAVMRSICRVENTGSPALVFPTIQSATVDATIYATGYTGAWKGESEVPMDDATPLPVQDQPRWGESRIPVKTWNPDAVVLSRELLDDAGANVESIVNEAIAETKGLDEDAGFLNGNGIKSPFGLTNAGVIAVNSGAASALTYGGLIDLFSNLPAQYRQQARWLMNSKTYGAILKLADSQGMPIIPQNSLPDQLWQKPISFSEFLPDVAANAHPIYFGAFRYYVIADRQDLRIQRLVERFAPGVGLLPTARVGGKVSRLAAFRRLKVSA